jgi:hypothetical protein
VLVLAACGGCGRIGFDARADAANGAIDAAMIDAVLPTGPFGPPMVVGELNTTSSEDDISLTADLLEIYFMTARTGTNVLHRATRASATEPWSTPSEVLDLTVDINNPRISNDGLTLYFATGDAPNVGMQDLWFATRPDRSSPWQSPQPLPGINTTGNEIEPWMLDTQLVLYFTLSSSGIMRAERSSRTDPFGPATVVDPLVASGYQGTAWVDESEQLVLFHSDSTPNRELFYSTRVPAQDWAAPLVMSELNSPSSDADPWMSPDRHVVFFVSTRNGNYDVFMATR